MSKEKIYIVMPAYNEEANIRSTISEWHGVCERLEREGHEARLVIANDGSKDRTWNVLVELQKSYPLLIALNKPNTGHGATVHYLYRYSLEQGVDYVFQTDSDGQTLSDEFRTMWDNRHASDFHIGVRTHRQDGVGRVFVTKVLRMVVRLIFHVRVEDANTPFRLMRAERLKAVLTYIPEDMFLTNVAISAIAVKKGEKTSWYPITFRPRQGGVNSINIRRIIRIGFRALSEFRMINKRIE
jgi:glycosyltransferase involved in cell wall biosynthesis